MPCKKKLPTKPVLKPAFRRWDGIMKEREMTEREAMENMIAMQPKVEALRAANPDAEIAWEGMKSSADLPPGWFVYEFDPYMSVYYRKDRKMNGKNDYLKVLVSCRREEDGRRWVHVSLSRESRLPSYQDMKDVKNVFLGTDAKAIQIFAPLSMHVNTHPFVLHLWQCLDGDGLPDFTRGLGEI